jgi:hypothetical protein
MPVTRLLWDEGFSFVFKPGGPHSDRDVIMYPTVGFSIETPRDVVLPTYPVVLIHLVKRVNGRRLIPFIVISSTLLFG